MYVSQDLLEKYTETSFELKFSDVKYFWLTLEAEKRQKHFSTDHYFPLLPLSFKCRVAIALMVALLVTINV